MQFTELDRDDWHQEHYLETIMEVESISSRRQSLSTVLPELPLYAHLVAKQRKRVTYL